MFSANPMRSIRQSRACWPLAVRVAAHSRGSNESASTSTNFSRFGTGTRKPRNLRNLCNVGICVKTARCVRSSENIMLKRLLRTAWCVGSRAKMPRYASRGADLQTPIDGFLTFKKSDFGFSSCDPLGLQAGLPTLHEACWLNVLIRPARAL